MSNFVVYKSSAGSGKTFTLVKEYLRLALHDEKKIGWNYKRILAVTFTNKAAAEMKQRVIDALHQICNSPGLPTVGKIVAEELQVSEQTLKARAGVLLSSILHNYSDFSIGTIDSFTHKIVKTFAYDLDLPVNFNLETDVDAFYQKVISELLGRIGEDQELTRLLREYALDKAEDNASWDPEKSITEFVKLLQKENAGYYIQQLARFSAADLEEFRKEFRQFVSGYKLHLKTLASKATALMQQHHLGPAQFWYKKSGPANFFYKCLEGDIDPKNDMGSRLKEAIEKNKWFTEPHDISVLLTQTARELTEYIKQNYPRYALSSLMNRQIYQLMLIKKIEEISRGKKEEEQIVFISEFNQKIFELINNEPTPFIYERLGEKYHHYLLDEFQDTSALQWQNILPLLDNSLANGWFNLIVGDGKQSIYRWRNANVKQFARLPEAENPGASFVVQERIDSLKRNFEGRALNTNYRSVKTIVTFNNQLFSALSSLLLNQDFAAIYQNHEQIAVIDEPGYITVQTGKMDKDLLEDFNCSQIREHILSAIESGFSYQDICIITRTNRHGSLIADYLAAENIPVVSSDSLLLQNNLEVNTLVCFLNYLNNNEDKVSAAAVLNYLFQSAKITSQQYAAALSALSAQESLFKILTDSGIKVNAEDFLLRNLLDNCILIVSALGLTGTNHLYVRFFLDEVNEFLVTKNSGLLQFLQWWDNRRKKASVIIPANSNAVKIMTVHASKGLEFPVVIIPFCNWDQYKENEAWVDLDHSGTDLPVAVMRLSSKIKDAGLEKELEEEKQQQFLDNLNLLYVAFTRAAERLHVITAYGATNKKALVAHWIDKYLSDKCGTAVLGLYEFGEKKPALAHSHKSFQNYPLPPLSFNTGNGNIHIKSSFLHGSNESENSKRKGIILHAILSKITTTNDVESALESALLGGSITYEETASLRQKIQNLLGHELLKEYYTPNVTGKTEHELITADGNILRPDKIVFTDSQTVIIDYKTGSENNKKYFHQMMSYENALKEMGHHQIKKIIAYIDQGEVVLL